MEYAIFLIFGLFVGSIVGFVAAGIVGYTSDVYDDSEYYCEEYDNLADDED